MSAATVVQTITRWAEEHRLPCDVSLGGNIAVFSRARRHRFVLTRTIGAGARVLAGIGLNPSTANAFIDDNTIRRGIGFGRAWGCGLYVMLNAYGWRDTDPDAMWAAHTRGEDIVGEHNDALIRLVLGQLVDGDTALAAWGKHARPDRVGDIATIADSCSVGFVCLGTNKDGSPKHPLYLPKNTLREAWEMRR